MSFIWPPMLLSLALIPLGVLLYRFLDGRRRRRLAAYGGAGAQGTARRPGFRSRVPAALLLLGLVVMSVALARPQAVVSLPRQEGTVILAFDVSASMAATDLAPTRIAAAKVAAMLAETSKARMTVPSCLGRLTTACGRAKATDMTTSPSRRNAAGTRLRKPGRRAVP